MIVVAAVIRMGRIRSRPAWRIASWRPRPSFAQLIHVVEQHDAVVDHDAIRISKPIWAIRLKGVPVKASIQEEAITQVVTQASDDYAEFKAAREEGRDPAYQRR